jgi:hypothetical protein
MPSVALVHWNEDEASERAAAIEAAGYDVVVHWRQRSRPHLGDPDVVVVSLDRLPSHGRAVVDGLWSARTRRHIPVIFAGGTDVQVASTRESFPRAAFCATDEVIGAIATALAG